jgi:GNAT superfamily N-acetyltransferase
MPLPHLSPSDIGTIDRMQENLVAYFRLFAGLPGVTVADDDVFWLASAQPEPGNHVLRARIPSHAVEARIDQIFDQVGRHTDQIDWLVFPGCRPADLGRCLEARGMAAGPGGAWMLADLTSPPQAPAMPGGFRVAWVSDDGMLAEWKRLSGAGFGGDVQIFYDAYARHGFGPEAFSLHYIGYLNDEPVTSATLLIAGGIAGTYDISTPPSLRGRGFGGAITLSMLHEARRRGYRAAWTWASAMGKSVYERVGFVAADFGVREYRWRKR